MSQSSANDTGNIKEAKPPRRDWILLPLIGMLTVGLLAGSLELIGRSKFHAGDRTIGSCLIKDSSTGVRGIPYCVWREESPEIEPVEDKFNRCGHRASLDCEQKTPDTYRIVMMGSSFAEGADVQRDKTFATLLPLELSRQTGHKVELYNEGSSGTNPQNAALSFNEVLAAKPDAILWILTPRDFEFLGLEPVQKPVPEPDPQWWTKLGMSERARYRVKQALAGRSLLKAIPSILRSVENSFVSRWATWKESTSGVLVLHCLYQSRSVYVKLWLKGKGQAGFLMEKSDPEWQYHLEQFNRYDKDIEGRAKTAGVPLVAVLVPNRAQAAMISMGEWPVGYDPYKLDDELRFIIVSHGGIYIDILPDYRNIHNPEQGYLLVDGHPNVDGNAMISKFLAKELTSGTVPALSTAQKPQIAMEQGR